MEGWMPKFYVVLQSQTDEHKRFTTISRVPCSKCENDPLTREGCRAARSPYRSEVRRPLTSRLRRTRPAAHLEAMEASTPRSVSTSEETIARYPTLSADALDVVMDTTVWYPEDTHTVDGRFLRKGKVTPARGNPDYDKMHKGWRAFHEQEKPYKVKSIGIVGRRPVNAVTGGLYGTPLKNLFGGNRVWDWDTDTIKCALTTSRATRSTSTRTTSSTTSRTSSRARATRRAARR
jgi:hypothetical protein